jgi:outer membrane protein assembly factor BamB
MPADWSAGAADEDDMAYLTFRQPDTGGLFHVRILPPSADDFLSFDAFDEALLSLSLSGYSYNEAEWFGQNGYTFAVNTPINGQPVRGMIGRLPDQRLIIAIGVEPQFTHIMNSLTFSADSPPNPPTYSSIWNNTLPAPIESPFDAPEPRIAGLSATEEQVLAVDAARGVVEFDATTGGLIGVYPFLNPSTPTGIAALPNGEVIIGDSVCRCLQRLTAARQWGESFGSFAGNAPFSLMVSPSGSLYAVDSTDEGYVLRIFLGGTDREIPMNFNAAAPPLIAVGMDQVYVIEWLQSLIDNQTSGAVSLIQDGVPMLQYWLPFTPEEVSAASVSADGHLVLALSDGRVMQADETGNLTQLFADSPTPRAITFQNDQLYLARNDGSIIARSLNAPPERRGSPILQPDVPVQGTVSDLISGQRWTFEGEAGQVVTLSATDLQRRDTVDMALRLLSPNGSELAYNDDQLGVDLFGIFDAQIPDLVLPETGTYTVIVEHVGGSGTYTLGLTADRRFALENSGVTLRGELQDVFPVQRWVFSGQRGQVVTFTMTATGGTLDPALELLLTDGRTLAYNDDGADPELGTNAQLFRITLPADGDYVLEASRFEGSGEYSIVAVVNN